MKFTAAAVIALGALPAAYSLSYLESLGSASAAPSISSAAPASSSQPPFFFTDGPKDQPAQNSDFFFSNGSNDAPIAPGNYMDALASSSSSGAPTGAGMPSYLDALPRTASSPTGAGIPTYKDSLPVSNTHVGTGSGMASYTDNLSGGRSASASPAYQPPPQTQAAPASQAASSSNYMDSVSSTSAGPPTGAGMRSYLDALPQSASSISGPGIPTYKDALPVTNTHVGTGSGMASYTDNLSGGRSSSRPAAYQPPAGAQTQQAPASQAGAGSSSDGFVSGPPSGAGMRSYLDALPQSASSISGPGIPTYKDSLPVTNTHIGTGSGMASYTDNLSGGRSSSRPAAYQPPANTQSQQAPAAQTGSASSDDFVSGPPSGAGMRSYLDALPQSGSSISGPGIPTYKDSLPVTNTHVGTGSGMASYTDNLSGGRSSSRPAAYQPPANAQTQQAPSAQTGSASSDSFVSGPPSGAGMASYLDALPRSGSSPSGPGIPTYKDSLPVTNTHVGTGSGMASYTDNLSGGRSYSAPSSYQPPAANNQAYEAPAAQAQPVSSDSFASGPPSGAGMRSYLDALPRGASAVSGPGIPTYKDSLPVSNTFAGTGSGMASYTDNLGGGRY